MSEGVSFYNPDTDRPKLQIVVSLNRRQTGNIQQFYGALIDQRLSFVSELREPKSFADLDYHSDYSVGVVIVRPNPIKDVYPEAIDLEELSGRLIGLQLVYPCAQYYIDAGRWVSEINAYVRDPKNRARTYSTDITFEGVVVSPDANGIILDLHQNNLH